MIHHPDKCLLFSWSSILSRFVQGLGITHIVNTAEGDKSANVNLDVDQLEANGNHLDQNADNFDHKWL